VQSSFNKLRCIFPEASNFFRSVRPRQARTCWNLFSVYGVLLAGALILSGRAVAGDTVLHNFTGPAADGANAYGALIHDKYGNLYGTTKTGGTHKHGTVFVMCAPFATAPDLFPCTTGLPSWKEFILYNFKGLPANDGANPTGRLVFNGLYGGRAFTLYGTTYNGGKPNTCASSGAQVGCGTAFELCAPSNFGGCGGVNVWKERVIHRFIGGKDGSHPFGGLITDKASDLFGTTVFGGGLGTCTGTGGGKFCGTVFRLKGQSPWTFPELVLYRFSGGSTDGANPYATLCCDTIFAIPFLYGTTRNGGSGSSGTVFQIKNVAGFPETILYNFCSVSGCPDGANPYSDVIFDGSGNIYGTTANGGANSGGIAYELSPAGPPWNLTVLYPFCSILGCPDGSFPTGDLVFDGSGNLYGTTAKGGSSSLGTVFILTPAGPPWAETVLNNFLGGSSDGANPFAGVTYDPPVSPTELYGVTVKAGSASMGIVYSVP